MSAKIGAHIKPSEPVTKLASEGPLDQMMGIHVDDNMTDPVFLQSVLNENDLFQRCPALGSIDFDKKVGGKSLKELLESEGFVTDSLFLNPSGEGLQKFAEVVNDRYGISDAKWMDDPQELIWKTPLLAQLQAKYNAITHFLNDPGAVDFEGVMSDEEKAAVAQRARELAAQLKDQALNEIDQTADEATANLRETVSETKQRFNGYVVTREDAKAAGGLTEGEVADLFQGGE
jgi:hypothetical protein